MLEGWAATRPIPPYCLRMARFDYFIINLFPAFFVLVLVFLSAGNVAGAELHNSAREKGAAGDLVTLAVMVDKVEKLAGIKLVLEYDEKVLKFVRAEKTQHTANMLHVVNDKTPGKLIIVMASARGFSAENVELVQLSYELLTDVKKGEKAPLQIIRAELMGDDLRRIGVQFN
jgi:hypothetical protein